MLLRFSFVVVCAKTEQPPGTQHTTHIYIYIYHTCVSIRSVPVWPVNVYIRVYVPFAQRYVVFRRASNWTLFALGHAVLVFSIVSYLEHRGRCYLRTYSRAFNQVENRLSPFDVSCGSCLERLEDPYVGILCVLLLRKEKNK